MIKLLRDVQGFTTTGVIIPFTFVTPITVKNAVKLEAVYKQADVVETVNDGAFSMMVPGEAEPTEETVIGPVDVAYLGRVFFLKVNKTECEPDSLYIRVYNDEMSYISPKINICRGMELEFATQAKPLAFKPKKIRINDNVACTYQNAVATLTKDKFTISILISNNATSLAPVWENVTDAYLANQELVFTNGEKDDDQPWAVSVKYQIAKTISDSTVEISDIALMIL